MTVAVFIILSDQTGNLTSVCVCVCGGGVLSLGAFDGVFAVVGWV